MSKRTSRFAAVLACLVAIAVGGFSLAMLSKANAPPAQTARRSTDADPATTGTLGPVRWCGAAPWCR